MPYGLGYGQWGALGGAPRGDAAIGAQIAQALGQGPINSQIPLGWQGMSPEQLQIMLQTIARAPIYNMQQGQVANTAGGGAGVGTGLGTYGAEQMAPFQAANFQGPPGRGLNQRTGLRPTRARVGQTVQDPAGFAGTLGGPPARNTANLNRTLFGGGGGF